jgi:hypothetical protein
MSLALEKQPADTRVRGVPLSEHIAADAVGLDLTRPLAEAGRALVLA